MPHYKHDCMDPSCCRYAGSFDDVDVYVSKSGTVILRTGDEGPDYASYPEEIAVMVAERSPRVNRAVEMIKTNIRR